MRLKPDERKVEGLSSRTQYGNAFDVYGHFFAHNNSIHQRHEVIAARYLERNPHLLLPSAMAEISDHGNNNIMPITHGARFDLLTEAGPVHVGVRAHGLHRRRLPRGLRRHDVHRRAGAQPRAPRRADAEGLDLRRQPRPRTTWSSWRRTDSWFRPVNFYIGPDGALYVIDYYRPYIEHPEWASSDLQKSPEVLSTGKDRGRIYRVVATTGPAATRTTMRPKLGSATDAQLVEALGSRNVWWRRTAQRLLVHGNRRDAAPALMRTRRRASVGARAAARALDARGPRPPRGAAGAAGADGPRPRRARERDRPGGALAVAAAVSNARCSP